MSIELRLELFPADVDSTVAFYVGVLGFSITKDDRPTGGRYVAVRRDGVLVGLAEAPVAGDSPEARRPPTGVEIVVEVDDVRAERDRIVAAGWPLDSDLEERPWGLTDFRVLDPDGYYLRFTNRA